MTIGQVLDSPVQSSVIRSSLARFNLFVVLLFLLQGAIWIALPLLLEGSIRLDVAEGVIDGPNWQLSYLRHPPLSSWLSGLATYFGSFRYAAVYALGWAFASGAFVLLALFLRRNDSPKAGLVALLAGLASPFATYVPLNFNHNITTMLFWALSLAAAWRAFSRGSLGDWLILGAMAGFGLWAKYALLHLLAPLAILFWFVPEWRRQAAKPGPWLAILLCGAIIAPHFADAFGKGATTVQFAVRTATEPLAHRLLWIGEFALNCALTQVCMALLATAAAGPAALASAWRQLRMWRPRSRFEQFLTVAALGPVLIILLAALFGVRPHFLWQTPFAISFAAFWGHAAASAGVTVNVRRLFRVFIALSAVLAVSYVSVREIEPRVSRRISYEGGNGPKLAARAQNYWAQRHTGRIPFLVSQNIQRGRQAAGSIAFDLPYRVETLEEGDLAKSPWFDIVSLEHEGALVVMTEPPVKGLVLLGAPVENIEAIDRPAIFGERSEKIYFGELKGRR